MKVDTDTHHDAGHYAASFAQMDALGISYRLNLLADEQEGNCEHWNAALLREAATRISPPKTP